jgi:hypothetical protein
VQAKAAAAGGVLQAKAAATSEALARQIEEALAAATAAGGGGEGEGSATAAGGASAVLQHPKVSSATLLFQYAPKLLFTCTLAGSAGSAWLCCDYVSARFTCLAGHLRLDFTYLT